MIKNSRRAFSKWMVALNSILAWVTMIYSIYQHESAYVAAAGFAFIAGLGGYYMNVGHRDLKETLNAISSSGKPSNEPFEYNGPAMPEPPKEIE